MQLTVTHEEARALADLLHAYLPELHEEVFRTDTASLREQLQRRESVLSGFLTRLGALLAQPRPS